MWGLNQYICQIINRCIKYKKKKHNNNYLIVNDIWMWRRVERIDGLEDVMCQIGQVDNGISHHGLHVGCTSHQEREWSVLWACRRGWCAAVVLFEDCTALITSKYTMLFSEYNGQTELSELG